LRQFGVAKERFFATVSKGKGVCDKTQDHIKKTYFFLT
jgi:hypothetical protein